MAPECVKYHKRIAELVSIRTQEDYSKIMNHIRTRVRFTLLKSTLIAIRGERGKQKKSDGKCLFITFFGFIASSSIVLLLDFLTLL